MGFDRRSVTKPSLAIPPAMKTAPTSTASIPASAIRSSGLAASGMIVAATRGDTALSGPSTRIREGPKIA